MGEVVPLGRDPVGVFYSPSQLGKPGERITYILQYYWHKKIFIKSKINRCLGRFLHIHETHENSVFMHDFISESSIR